MADFLLATDQASGLRRLFEKRAASIIAVASTVPGGARPSDGTRVALQLAEEFLSVGRTLTVLDEHPPPGGISNVFGISSHKDLKHALRGDYPLDEVAFSPAPGLTLIPASRAAGMELTLGDEASLNGNLVLLRSRSDCVMIDCAPRAARALSPIAASADRLLVVVPGHADDLTRAYGFVKRVVTEKITLPVSVVVVRAADARQARIVYDKLRRVAFDHLGVVLHYLGAALTLGAPRLSLAQASAMSGSPIKDYDEFDALSGRGEMIDSMV